MAGAGVPEWQRQLEALPGWQRFKLTPKSAATLLAVSEIKAGELLTYSQLAERAGNARAALATSTVRHNLYEIPGAEFVLPLHRIMSTGDHFARIDGTTGLGSLGRAYKVALREAEGCFANIPVKPGSAKKLTLPSVGGIPAGKPGKKKKRKHDDATSTGDGGGGASQELSPAHEASPAVTSATCADLLEKIEAYVGKSSTLTTDDAFTQGKQMMA